MKPAVDEPRPAVGFHDSDGNLKQWRLEDCQQWQLVSLEPVTLYSQGGTYVIRSEQDILFGKLGRIVPPMIAAEIMLRSGFELPSDLLRLIGRQPAKPKIEKRSKSRKPPRAVPGQHGLAGFANSKRSADSRGPNG